MAPEITEKTSVRLKLSAAWTIVTTVIVTTAWLTGLLVNYRSDNQREHEKLMYGLTELNTRSQNWATKEEVEEALIYTIRTMHSDAALPTWRITELREGIREKLRSPKDRP